jgi:branched-chain amino acid aminotransferase
VEKQIKPEEVYRADSAFYCGTAAEVAGIASLDDVVFPKAWQESLGYRIQQAYKCKVVEKEYQIQRATA